MNRQTREEFEAEAARLKAAVRKEYQKEIKELYPSLTIRQALELWVKAKGPCGNRDVSEILNECAFSFDLDRSEDFERWLPNSGHALDLVYDMILFRPERAFLGDGTEGWTFCLQGSNAPLLATYTERLHESDVLFYLFDPQKTMKGLGYWVRSRRREYK